MGWGRRGWGGGVKFQFQKGWSLISNAGYPINQHHYFAQKNENKLFSQ